MKIRAVTHNKRPVLLSIVFFVALLSTTALQISTHPHSALAYSDTYPTSIAGCRAVSGSPTGYFNCDLKDSAQDIYYDPWGEENRECTSYVSWMLHSINGFEMPFFANATDWGTKAAAAPYNYTVNMTPAVGSIYWTTSPSPWGHVAYVQSVSSDGTHVDTTDYNSDFTGHWGQELSVATSSASGYIHFKDISSPPPPPPLRIGAVDTSGNFWVKEASLNGQWTNEYSPVTQGVVSGTLIGELSGGTFQVKQPSLNSQWTYEYNNVTAGAVSDGIGTNPLRVGVLTNGIFQVKEGSLTAQWTNEWIPTGTPVAGYLSASRIGVLSSDGTLYVKDGGLSAQWATEATGVSQAMLSGSLIGVIYPSGSFYVKQGTLDANWAWEYSGVASAALSDATSSTPLRIGYVDTSGTFQVKEGSLTAPWTWEYGSVSQAVLSGNLIGELSGGAFQVKQPSVTSQWTPEYSGVTSGTLWSPN